MRGWRSQLAQRALSASIWGMRERHSCSTAESFFERGTAPWLGRKLIAERSSAAHISSLVVLGRNSHTSSIAGCRWKTRWWRRRLSTSSFSP
jgi:hypothetical protein